MMYSTKTALVIRADLLPWQVANIAAFLSGGLAGTYPSVQGPMARNVADQILEFGEVVRSGAVKFE